MTQCLHVAQLRTRFHVVSSIQSLSPPSMRLAPVQSNQMGTRIMIPQPDLLKYKKIEDPEGDMRSFLLSSY